MTASVRQYLTFVLGNESFGIAISSVKEIIEHRLPTEVPMMPAFVRGVINLRGRVVPVIDLQVRFGRAASQASRRSCIVIVEIGERGQSQDVGVLVDSVSAVLEIGEADIEPPPSFGTRLRKDFVTGMGRLGDGFVIVLDIDRVLCLSELAQLGELEAQCETPA